MGALVMIPIAMLTLVGALFVVMSASRRTERSLRRLVAALETRIVAEEGLSAARLRHIEILEARHG